MTTKIKLTREQAEAVKALLGETNEDVSQAIDDHADVFSNPEDKWVTVEFQPLNELSPSDLARALLIGYEVEPEPLKINDWVTEHVGDGFRTGKITGFTNKGWFVQFLSFDTNEYYFESFHAVQLEKSTPEEIAEEQERRKWLGIGRAIGGFKQGDILVDDGGRIYQTFEVDAKEIYELGGLKGFYPAESFVKFGGDE